MRPRQARPNNLPLDGLLFEACWCGPQAAPDELTAVTLTAVRVAAVALDADPVDVLAVLLVARTAAAYEPAEQARLHGIAPEGEAS